MTGEHNISIGARREPEQEFAYPVSLVSADGALPLARLHADGSAEGSIEEIEAWMKAQRSGQGNGTFFALLWVVLNELKRAQKS